MPGVYGRDQRLIDGTVFGIGGRSIFCQTDFEAGVAPTLAFRLCEVAISCDLRIRA
jgi:hypothetical protein